MAAISSAIVVARPPRSFIIDPHSLGTDSSLAAVTDCRTVSRSPRKWNSANTKTGTKEPSRARILVQNESRHNHEIAPQKEKARTVPGVEFCFETAHYSGSK